MAPLLRKPHKSEGMAALMAHLFVLSQSQCGADGIAGIFRSTSHESAVATEIAALPPWLGDGRVGSVFKRTIGFALLAPKCA